MIGEIERLARERWPQYRLYVEVWPFQAGWKATVQTSEVGGGRWLVYCEGMLSREDALAELRRRVLVADGCPHRGGTYYERAVISFAGRAVGRTYCSDCGTLLDVAPAETGAPGY